MQEIYLLTGMFLVTFSVRYLMFAVSGRIKLPETMVQALRYVPPAVLTAIVVPAVLITEAGELNLGLSNPRFMGAIAAGLVGWYSKNLLLTIVVGMAVFLGWQWVV
jgi:branched-subunit amino acid transport protein